MVRGVGTILKEFLAQWGIRESGCNCKKLSAEMDRVGSIKIRKDIERYTDKVQNSAKSWIKNKVKLKIPPPRTVVKETILWACYTHEKEKISG